MKKRILIVDDEADIRKIYKSYFYALHRQLFEIVEKADATEAANYLFRQKVDLIILDIDLPQIDGQFLHEVIKEYDPDLSVIIASVFPISKQKRMIPDAVDYFDKSQGPMKLLEMVKGRLFFS